MLHIRSTLGDLPLLRRSSLNVISTSSHSKKIKIVVALRPRENRQLDGQPVGAQSKVKQGWVAIRINILSYPFIRRPHGNCTTRRFYAHRCDLTMIILALFAGAKSTASRLYIPAKSSKQAMWWGLETPMIPVSYLLCGRDMLQFDAHSLIGFQTIRL